MNTQSSDQHLPVPTVGKRYRLRREVDRDPYFLALPGLIGTLIHCDEHLIRLQMDEAVTEEFDNCIEWYDYEPTFPLLNTFYEDCELLEETMYLRDRTIHVDGHILGYQFNRQSLGSRRFTRYVLVESLESQEGMAIVLGRKVRVRRILGSSQHWEALALLGYV